MCVYESKLISLHISVDILEMGINEGVIVS